MFLEGMFQNLFSQQKWTFADFQWSGSGSTAEEGFESHSLTSAVVTIIVTVTASAH